MLSVHGYFDGTAIRPLEKLPAKPNQRVIITVMDDFIGPDGPAPRTGMRGILAQYADPALAEKEKGAWERTLTEKYGTV